MTQCGYTNIDLTTFWEHTHFCPMCSKQLAEVHCSIYSYIGMIVVFCSSKCKKNFIMQKEPVISHKMKGFNTLKRLDIMHFRYECEVCGEQLERHKHSNFKCPYCNNLWMKEVKAFKAVCRNDLKDWKKSILERDNYTCTSCGEHTNTLNVHHLYSFSKICNEEIKELNATTRSNILKRHKIEMGTTLCFDCHAKIHPWMKK